jgi:hypothetical protein
MKCSQVWEQPAGVGTVADFSEPGIEPANFRAGSWLGPGYVSQLDPAGAGTNFSATPFMQ